MNNNNHIKAIAKSKQMLEQPMRWFGASLFVVLIGLWACQQQKPTDNTQPQDSIVKTDSSTKNTTPRINYWDTVQVAQIKAYLYRQDEDSSWLIVQPSKRLHAGIVPQYTKTLPKLMADGLLKKLATDKPYARQEADCINYRHGLVFYNANQQIVGHMSICFECYRARLKPASLYTFHMQELKTIFNALKMPMFDNPLEAHRFWKEKVKK